MRSLHEAAGAVFGSIHGVEVARHYGDPAGEYEAAVGGVALFDRSHRTRMTITGRAPAQMIQGVLTGRIPGPPTLQGDVDHGRWEYSLVLTPKGRIVSDLRIGRLPGEDEEFVLDIPVAGQGALVDYFRRVLPPRMAKTDDVSDRTGMLTVTGPDAASVLSRDVFGLRVDASALEGLEEGDAVRFPGHADPASGLGLQLVRSFDLAAPTFDLIGSREDVRGVWRRLIESGACAAGHGVFQTLRVEAGRPALGVDMGEDTIPYEAGVVERAVDHAKGCYTGQEVIVRIRDRGHVNRHLRGLRLEEGAVSKPGSELFAVDGEKPIGVVTSVADSPRAGRSIALAYVRREVEPGDPVRLGSPDGAVADVRELRPGWAL